MIGFGFDISKFLELQRTLGTPAGAAQMEPCYRQWGIRYLSAMRRKFIDNSAGGGDWPALKTSTVYSRMRKAKKLGYARVRGITGRLSILWDTGTLLRALDVGAPGNLFQLLMDGIRVGFGGPARHPGTAATIGDIAAFHNSGIPGKLPRRQLIWPPDADVGDFMLRSFQSHVLSLMRGM